MYNSTHEGRWRSYQKDDKALFPKDVSFCHIWPVHPASAGDFFLFHLHALQEKCSGRSEKRFRKHVRLCRRFCGNPVKQHIDHFHEYRILPASSTFFPTKGIV